jgi:hypothetical protein
MLCKTTSIANMVDFADLFVFQNPEERVLQKILKVYLEYR